MFFCSQAFLVFYLVVFCAYWSLPWHQARVWLLLVASFVFYASWNHWLAGLIVLTSTLDYLLARCLEAARSLRLRRLLLGVNVFCNLGLLCYLKYANFFLASLESSLRALGVEASLPVLRVILPIGISFYTFEALSYMIDVYKGRLRAERSLPHFMLFILFFPHLVAGPIVRARDFLPQVRRRKRWSWPRTEVGVQYLLLGLIKKMVIADSMALFVDPVFASPASYRTAVLWFALIAYAVQIYCDFSGYSDLALGTAHLLGYHLAINFDLPYLSANIAEFWRRWHMSLSSWLRDYLFIPLGGSRCGRWRTAINLLITMTACGLWHGTHWNFVLFGVVHGCWLSLHLIARDLCRARPGLDGWLQTTTGTAVRVATTLFLFTLTLVLFRTNSLGDAWGMLTDLFVPHPGNRSPELRNVWVCSLVLMVLGHWLGWKGQWKRLVDAMPAPVLGLGYACFLMLALLLTPIAGQVFIYFQF